MKLVLEQFTK